MTTHELLEEAARLLQKTTSGEAWALSLKIKDALEEGNLPLAPRGEERELVAPLPDLADAQLSARLSAHRARAAALEEAAREIPILIASDIANRKGLGDEWDQIDDDIRTEILEEWSKRIRALKTDHTGE